MKKIEIRLDSIRQTDNMQQEYFFSRVDTCLKLSYMIKTVKDVLVDLVRDDSFQISNSANFSSLVAEVAAYECDFNNSLDYINRNIVTTLVANEYVPQLGAETEIIRWSFDLLSSVFTAFIKDEEDDNESEELTEEEEKDDE